ncbi:MAG: phage tail protein [Lapillicoccus sp.]
MRSYAVEVRWDGQVVSGVSGITPMRTTVEAVILRDGASGAVHTVPGRTTVTAMRLERGVSDDLAFHLWASGPPLRKDVEINLLDAADQLGVGYRLFQCWVSDYAVAPDVATGSVIESVTLSLDRWERVIPAPLVLADRLAQKRSGTVRRVSLKSLLTGHVEETERNLDALLAEAAAADTVLLFDEADALFADRTEVLDAHDRYAATEVDSVLQRLSQHPGEVVVTPPHEA